MRFSQLTMLAFDLNAALDAGMHATFSYDDLISEIRNGDPLAAIKGALGNRLDLSLWSETDKTELRERWNSFNNAIDASRKFGVNRSGLSLALAYTLEEMSQRAQLAKVP